MAAQDTINAIIHEVGKPHNKDLRQAICQHTAKEHSFMWDFEEVHGWRMQQRLDAIMDGYPETESGAAYGLIMRNVQRHFISLALRRNN